MSIKGILRVYSSVGRAMVSKTRCHRFDSGCTRCGLLQVPHCVRESSKAAKLRIFAVVLKILITSEKSIDIWLTI